jgi:cobalt/nickel transport system permease protein
MHIPDGILPVPVTAAGYAATAAITWYSVRKINRKPNPQAEVPKASLLTAAFFVASWIHIPVPPASVHLVLSGMMGAMLGWFAFPAIVIGLFFQAVMFQHGGLTTLGVNALIMGLPALAAFGIFRLRKLGKNSPGRVKTATAGFVAGSVAIALSVALFVVILITNIPADIDAGTERAAIITLALSHVPLLAVEGVVTAALAVFLLRVRPRLLDGV